MVASGGEKALFVVHGGKITPLVQLLANAHGTFNPLVAGSNPARPTIKSKTYKGFLKSPKKLVALWWPKIFISSDLPHGVVQCLGVQMCIAFRGLRALVAENLADDF